MPGEPTPADDDVTEDVSDAEAAELGDEATSHAEADEAATDDDSERAGEIREDDLKETAPPPRVRRSSQEAAAGRPPSRFRRPGRRGKEPTTAGATRRSGRYTAPIPREVRRSPAWYPWVLLTLLILGLLSIVLNYVNVLPGGTNNWYLIGGIVAMVIGLFMATFYH